MLSEVIQRGFECKEKSQGGDSAGFGKQRVIVLRTGGLKCHWSQGMRVQSRLDSPLRKHPSTPSLIYLKEQKGPYP